MVILSTVVAELTKITAGFTAVPNRYQIASAIVTAVIVAGLTGASLGPSSTKKTVGLSATRRPHFADQPELAVFWPILGRPRQLFA
jgi:hypothetical protein